MYYNNIETDAMLPFSGKMSWSVSAYLNVLSAIGTRCTGMQEDVEEHLLKRFPPQEMETMAAPCLVVDSEDIVLMWFLPNLLVSERQVGWLKFSYKWHLTLRII